MSTHDTTEQTSQSAAVVHDVVEAALSIREMTDDPGDDGPAAHVDRHVRDGEHPRARRFQAKTRFRDLDGRLREVKATGTSCNGAIAELNPSSLRSAVAEIVLSLDVDAASKPRSPRSYERLVEAWRGR